MGKINLKKKTAASGIVIMGASGFHVMLHSTPLAPLSYACDYVAFDLILSIIKNKEFPLSRAIYKNIIQPIPHYLFSIGSKIKDKLPRKTDYSSQFYGI